MIPLLSKRVFAFTMVALYCTSAVLHSADSNHSEPNTDTAPIAENTGTTAPFTTSVSPARNFGYVIGDVLIQEVLLPDTDGNIDLRKLVDIRRVSTWLERQSTTVTADTGDTPTLVLRYQIINSPPSIISAALPELSLTSGSDSHESVGTVAAWPFTLGPLTSSAPLAGIDVSAPGGDHVNGVPMQADMTLPPVNESGPAARFRLALLVLGLTLVCWAGWYFWRNHRDKVQQPFARARQSLRSRQQRKHGDADIPWKTLHQAFNQTAGHVVNASSVDELLQAHDWLQPLENRIRAFYAASAARHYVLPSRDEPFELEELARALARRERRNSR